jgi:hypothetical protein
MKLDLSNLDLSLRVFLVHPATDPIIWSPSMMDAFHKLAEMSEVERTGRLAMLLIAFGAAKEIFDNFRHKPPDDTSAEGKKPELSGHKRSVSASKRSR